MIREGIIGPRPPHRAKGYEEDEVIAFRDVVTGEFLVLQQIASHLYPHSGPAYTSGSQSKTKQSKQTGKRKGQESGMAPWW